jgi:hypothetical protein
VFQAQWQMSDGDCSVASLSMATGIPYHTIADTARQVGLKKVIQSGMWLTEMEKLLDGLNPPVYMRVVAPQRAFDEGYGLVVVKFLRTKEYHSLAVWHGLVCDPLNGLLWEPDVYLGNNSRTKYQNGVLLFDKSGKE